jgi:zinc protease
MRDAIDDQKDWDLERGAIEQEVAQDLSNPFYVMYEKLRATMFAGSTYEHDALGTRPSFDKTTAQMLKRFHDKWYAPNNAILIIVGDVDLKATLGDVKTLFGALKPKKLPARPKFVLGPPKAATFSLDTDRPNATDIVAIRMPGLDSKDFPALELLADVLNSHRFSLYGLVPEGKAVETEFYLDALPKAGIAYAAVTFPVGGDPKAIEAEVRAILAKVREDGVTPDLVAAAKLGEQRSTEFQKNSIGDLASVWSDAVALYGLRSPEDDLVRIEKVSVADVNRVARKYLDVDNAVSVTLVPRGSGKGVASSASYGGGETIGLGEGKPTELPDWANAALSRLSVPPSTVHPVVSSLSNGLTLIVQPEDVSDSVTVYGHVRNRPETEAPAGQEGVNLVLDRLFPFGTQKLDRLAYQSALDQIGAEEQAGMDFWIQVLSQHFDRGVELLADNELNPALPPEAMNVVRAQLTKVVAARNMSPAWLSQRALRESIYPKNDPSLRDATPESISGLTLDALRAYHKLVVRPDLTTIIVVGKITPEAARAAVEKYFGSWTANGPKPNTDLAVAPPNTSGAVAVPDDSRVQDSVVLAQNLGLKRSDPDYYALALGNAVLGGGFYSTRFSVELRKKAGLVYSVGSNLEATRTRGAYVVRYACDPQNVSKAAGIVVRELKSMQSTAVPAAELTRVKALLLRQIPLGESSVNEIARRLAENWDLELPLDEPTLAAQHYIALEPEDVRLAFSKWMRPSDLVRVTQGPPPQ